MPRLDNQSGDLQAFYGYNWRPNQDIAPIDLCSSCFREWEGEDRDDVIDHPPYEDQVPSYHCVDCGARLGARDN